MTDTANSKKIKIKNNNNQMWAMATAGEAGGSLSMGKTLSEWSAM